jgi:hypothetical protein
MVRMKKRILAAFWLVAGLVAMVSVDIRAAQVNISDQPPQAITVRNVSVKDGVVSGEVVNSSPRTIRDVQLLIRFTWLWSNERHPGEDSRGDAVYQTVEGEIPAGGSKPFTYRSSSKASEGAGRYEVSVKVAGYTELIPAK